MIHGAYHKREFDIARFGMVDTFFMFHFAEKGITQDWIQSISGKMFDFGLKNKSGIPRGLGGGLVVYSVFMLDSPSEEIKKFFYGYCPEHWASNEFPVLIDINSNAVFFLTGTPMWGALYYDSMRSYAMRMLYHDGGLGR